MTHRGTFEATQQLVVSLSRVLLLCVVAVFAITAPRAQAQTTVAGFTPGSFSVSPSGAATYTIPIQVPPGIAGVEPKLALVYNSQSGNGPLGMGWGLSGLSAVSRCPRTITQDGIRGGVTYDSNDRFCLDGQRLMPVSGTVTDTSCSGTEYRTELETFTRVIACGTAGNGPASFKVLTKAGQIMEYGNTPDSRIEAVPATNPVPWPLGTVRVWALNRIADRKSNYLTVSYSEDATSGDYYPVEIDYTGNGAQAPGNSIQIQYQPRTDIVPMYEGGALIRTTQRASNVRTFIGTPASGVLVKDYRMTYDNSYLASARPRLSTITECDAAGACLAAISLGKQDGGTGVTIPNPSSPALPASVGGYPAYASSLQNEHWGDFNGDGKLDYAWIPYGQTFWLIAYGTDAGFTLPDPTHPALPASVGGYLAYASSLQNEYWGDFNGDGKLDYAWIPYGQTFWLIAYGTDTGFTLPDPTHPALPASVGDYPAYASSLQNEYWGDFNGDGKLDYAWIPSGYTFWLIAYGTGTGFTVPNPAQPALPASVGGYPAYASSSQNEYFGDFNGDGKLDYAWIPNGQAFWLIAYGTDTGFTLPDPTHPALPASVGGYLAYASSLQNEYWGDFNGDGKLDYAWIPYGQTFWLIAYGTDTGFTLPDPTHPALPASVGGYPAYASSLQNEYWGDFNGDGKLDYAWIPYGYTFWLIAYGTGTGFTVPNPAQPALPASVGGYPAYASSLQNEHWGDFNGDGVLDYAWIPYGQTFWLIAYGTGTGFTVPNPAQPALPSSVGGYPAYASSSQNEYFGDFNGDGKLDFAWIPNGQAFWLIAYGNTTKQSPDLVNSISTLDGQTWITYKPLTDTSIPNIYARDANTPSNLCPYPNPPSSTPGTANLNCYPYQNIENPTYVVSSTVSSDGIGGTLTTNYKYGGLKSDLSGRGLLGFRTLDVTNPDSTSTHAEFRQDWPFTGMPSLSQKKVPSGGGTGGLVSNSSSSFGCTNPATGSACTIVTGDRYFPYVSQSTSSGYDLNGAALPTVTTTTVYDPYGNPTSVIASTGDGYSKTTTNTYATPDTANWFVGRLTRSTVTSVTP